MPITTDIKKLANDIYEAYKQSILAALSSNAPDIVAAANSYIVNGEARLKHLALNALNDNAEERLTYAFIVRRLREETVTLKDALLSIEQMIASDIEQLVFNLINIFENLLRSAILSINPIEPLDL